MSRSSTCPRPARDELRPRDEALLLPTSSSLPRRLAERDEPELRELPEALMPPLEPRDDDPLIPPREAPRDEAPPLRPDVSLIRDALEGLLIRDPLAEREDDERPPDDALRPLELRLLPEPLMPLRPALPARAPDDEPREEALPREDFPRDELLLLELRPLFRSAMVLPSIPRR